MTAKKALGHPVHLAEIAGLEKAGYLVVSVNVALSPAERDAEDVQAVMDVKVANAAQTLRDGLRQALEKHQAEHPRD